MEDKRGIPSHPQSNQIAHTPFTEHEFGIDPSLLNSLEWRLIGPYRAGRVIAVAGDPTDTQVFYFGSTGGGVWKTTDGGLVWDNISDGFFKRASVGAIAVSTADPNVLYVGMGESTIRGNVSLGDGVYKSTNKGQTWTHLGLENTYNIAKVRIHPQNPDLVYVAALGHAYGPNPERGVYRSSDGGKSWQHILFRSDKAGAIDLTMDPNNPRILYATFWETQRLPHSFISGGEGSGIFKSSDGGDTWTEITRAPGLPQGLLGKIGITVSPAQPGRVWAVIEAEDGALFRSDNGGESWQRLSEEGGLRQRAWYYMHIYPHPQDPDTLWIMNTQFWKSIDGGRSFFNLSTPHADNHDLWVDPNNPMRMIESNDGGANISFNGGDTWSSSYNQPTMEFYHVTTDTQIPYRVYGAQQDNTTICLPSRSPLAGITQLDWYDVGGGESGYIAVRPDDPNVVYAGSYQGMITRYDHRTRQSRNISVWPEMATGWGAIDQKYRFQWTAPIMLSPHDPNILYTTGNHVFRSSDEGSSWQMISPDLTRNDPTKLEASGGPITKDNTGAEYYCTIFAFAESPVAPGLLWAGSDDGLLHVSRNNGDSWDNVTIPDLPEWALISIIEPSPHDPATAYVAATRYKLEDLEPYLFKTNDYGASWTRITTGIREHDFTRVIREDPARRGLLYAGTETGIYISFDDGARWQSLQLNLPVVPIHDLAIKDTDLIVATHGRSFWILDDITPLRQINKEVQDSSVYLFMPRPTIRFMTVGGFSQVPPSGLYYRKTGVTTIIAKRKQKPNAGAVDYNLDAGQNPPDGVIVTYYLQQKPDEEVRLTFLDAQGNEIKTFSSEESQTAKDNKDKTELRIPKEAGTNRFVWDMRYPGAAKVDGFVGGDGATSGPVVAPGTYQLQLSIGTEVRSATFEVQKDPRVTATQTDLDAQLELRLRIRDKLTETHTAITSLRELKEQIEGWTRRTQGQENHEAIENASKSIVEKLSAVEEELIQTKAKVRPDALNHPVKLNAKLAALVGVVSGADAAPTRQAYELFDDLATKVDTQLQRLHEIIETDVHDFNTLLHNLAVPALIWQQPDSF
jgi:photosystem II stability/assembly factor-like uncharacterized protein